MGKALVLKNGVNFSANAVATINFADIPCTGITFSQNTYTVSGYDDVTVVYTVTPADTTDTVIWTSSDNNIVSVGNGIMTINGGGTCTITATCGSFSATATVTVTISCEPDWQFRGINVSNEFIAYGVETYNRLFAFGEGRQASEHTIISSASTEVPSPYAIKLPSNATKIRISRGANKGSAFYNDTNYHIIGWLQDVSSGSSTFPESAKKLSSETFNLSASASAEFTVPSGADCFVFDTRTATTYTSSDDSSTIATSLGLNIEFIYD